MGLRGAFEDGDTPFFKLSAAYTTSGSTAEIKRYALLSFSTETANEPTLEPCIATSSTSRSHVVGQAAMPFSQTQPYKNIADPYGNNKYRSELNGYLAVHRERATWFLVILPANGTAITIKPGDLLFPSTVTGADGGVDLRPASTLTASYVSTAIDAELAEDRRVIGQAWSRIHDYTLTSTDTGYSSDSQFLNGGPSLGVNELPNGTAFTASTSTAKIGYVFGALFDK